MLFVQVILPVFLIILAGFTLEKTLRPDFKTLTDCALYLFAPALVFSALMRQHIHFALAGNLALFMILYTAVLLGLAAATGRLLRLETGARSALSLTTAFMNIGNYGLPLTFFAFGNAALNVSVLIFVLFNIPLGSLAIVLAQGRKAPLLDALGNAARIPIFHAVLLAFACKVLELRVPDFILRPTELLGQAAVPLMLVLLGMQLARTRLTTARPGFISLICGIRLVLAPLIAWGLTSVLGIEGLPRKVLILQTSTPSAVLPLLYSLRFNNRPELVAGAILATTLLSAISLTVILYLLG